jgi:hypothetical protein
VNHFFLYIKQVNGEIYVNKDCKMNFNGSVGPIGHLKNTEQLLENTKKFTSKQLEEKALELFTWYMNGISRRKNKR